MQLHQTYMKEGTFEKLYLLHSFQGSRHFFTLFNFMTEQIIICVINPAVSKKLENPNELSAARNCFKTHLEELEAENEYAGWEIVTHIQFNELRDGLVYLDKQLAEYKTKNRNSTIILLQSKMTVEQLAVTGLKSLVTDFPVINTIVFKQDNSFPPLNWQ